MPFDSRNGRAAAAAAAAAAALAVLAGAPAAASAACIDKACTTHCDPNATDACCAPLTCHYDPVFSDTRCTPPAPLICGAPLPAGASGASPLPDAMSGFAANSAAGARSATFHDDSLPVPGVGTLHATFRDLPSNFSTCEVLIKVMASSVNPSDVTPAVARDAGLKGAEVVLGSDVSAVVVDTGSACKRLAVGSAVWGDIGANALLRRSGAKTKELGAYAEYAVALESQLGLKPTNMSFAEAGALPKVALTSYKALAWYGGAPWSAADNVTVLVLGGSGGTGTTGVQLARHFGAARIITTCGADNFAYCKANGADQLIDYHTQNWWDVLPDDSVQVVYDTVGQEGTGNYAMEKLTTGGHYVTITGALATKVKPGVHQAEFINSDTNLGNLEEMDALTAIANAGELRMPRIFATFGLADIDDAFALSQQGHVVGKVSVSVSNSTVAELL